MKAKEFIALCPKENQDETALLIYYDFYGRKKDYSIVSVHDNNVAVDHEAESVIIRFNTPKDGEIDESDTMSITEFIDFCNKNSAMDYTIEYEMNDGIFIHFTIPNESDVYIPDGFDCVCLCY